MTVYVQIRKIKYDWHFGKSTYLTEVQAPHIDEKSSGMEGLVDRVHTIILNIDIESNNYSPEACHGSEYPHQKPALVRSSYKKDVN